MEGLITRLVTAMALAPGTAVARGTAVAPAMAAVPAPGVALATAAQMALERDRRAMALARAKVERGLPAVRPRQVRPDAVTTRRSSSVSATKTTIAARPSGTKPALSWLILQVAAHADPHPTAVALQVEALVETLQAEQAAIPRAA